MKVAVVIPSFYERDGDYLKFCVDSLRSTVDWDIIVVTNGTPTKPDLRHIQGITRHLHNPDQGQCLAVNVGVDSTAPDTDYILISNSDMYYPPNWNKNLEFVSECMSLNCNFTWDPVEGLDYVVMRAGDTLDNFDKEQVDKFVPPKKVENGFTFPLIISKKLWNRVGGYDTNYDPWSSNSDSDLEYKVVSAGVQPKILRGVFVYHFGMKSGTFDGTKQDYWQHNWDYFVNKWGFERVDTPDIQRANLNIPLDKLKYKPDWSIYK